MVLIGIEGDLGSGKTIIAVRYILKDYVKGRKIFSNTPLFNIDFDEFDINAFLSNDRTYRDKLKNATILVDEITVYMDCRLSNSKQNLMMGYMVLQSRKRHVDIYFTTQDFDLCDFKRLIKYVKIMVYCQEIFTKNPNGELESIEGWRNFTIIDLRQKRNNVNSFNLDIRPFYKYYDTDYVIEPIIKGINDKEVEKMLSNEK